MLLLIPLRLGLDKFHADYVQSLARTFALPQSVGVLGGRPRGARWFFGSYADGTKILGLDPHTVQPALSTQQLQDIVKKSSDAKNGKNVLPTEYLESVHTQYPEAIDLIRMDPSIALGFYCRNRKDLQDLEQSLRHISASEEDASTLPELVTFQEKAANYEDGGGVLSESDVAANLMNGILLQDDDDDDDDAIIGGSQPKRNSNGRFYVDDDDDDEDYVLL